ncbi:hypothetical protein C8Q74DRAFT_1280163 [Fomes fomentarius]|nr:hypothetical protein C8Q74DRAFT_1280163 [Fomes fomentarius]
MMHLESSLPLCSYLPAMDNSRFPVETCEYIIDSVAHVHYARHIDRGRYDTWCRIALICSAWLPRSRFNMYRTVQLQRLNQVNQLWKQTPTLHIWSPSSNL